MIAVVLCILIFAVPVSSNTLNPPRVLTSSFYPCSDCHQGLKTNPQVRKLSFHEDILIKHNNLWCLDCHSPSDRNRLRLLRGRAVPFEDLPRLCATCHGSIYKEWSNGIHGKRIGQWNGKKNYFICTDCHNPHSPSFESLRPEPPPLRPEKTLRRY